MLYLLASEFQPCTMGFVVLPALPADISDVYDVYFAAFKDNAITRALFPSASASDMTDPDSEFRYVSDSSLAGPCCTRRRASCPLTYTYFGEHGADRSTE